jgi:2-keto-4-pentenoate hydratase/2-oxohepta-3-ene-1,7-dioic acid hydratase in catechol pathway
MKIARFKHKKKEHWGILNKDASLSLLKNPPYSKIEKTTKKVLLNKVRLLAPATPSKIILVGLNYKKHAKELNMKVPKEPIIFMKPPSALLNPGDKIQYPAISKRVDYEAELAIIIKKKVKNIKASEAKKYILGYTCLNDVTARDLQNKDGQWIRAKSFDTFCPIGPYLETKLNSSDLKIRAYLNGKIKQDSSTKDFIFSVSEIVSFVSRVMTLLPGDVISTGTPSGIGPMKKNDIIEIEIENIGRLKNKVA